MLWQEQFVPGSQNLPPLVRRYRGPLDLGAFGRALTEIVRRHEPLRCTFAIENGRPVQVVGPAQPVPLPVLDLSGQAPEDQEAELDRVLAEAARPFDLENGPLFEAQVVKLGAGHHVVVIRTHHTVYDDWSVSVFRRELSVLYRAFAAGEPSPLPELALGFADFAERQRARLAGLDGDAELSWWGERLAGSPLALELPIDDPDRPPGSPQPSPQPVAVDVPPELAAQLRALARRERTTLFMTLLAAFQVLVQHVTGQTDLLMATVVANRNRTELEPMIGCFTKKILLRLGSPGNAPFTDVVRRVRDEVLGVLAHQDLPFEAVLQHTLGPAAARHGLVPNPAVMFQGVAPQDEPVLLPGLTTIGHGTSATTRRAHFAAGAGAGVAGRPEEKPWGDGLYRGTFLILSVIEAGDRLSFSARGAFHRPAVESLLDSFLDVLGAIAAHPSRSISELAAGRAGGRPARSTVDLRGFPVDPARIEAVLVGEPGVQAARVRLGPDSHGAPQLEAHVEFTGSRPPTAAELRARLWAQLPGYAWPASITGVAEGRLPETGILARLWAERTGEAEGDDWRNYWQDFSFLEVVARARQEGLTITGRQVTRNRTIATLATDLAAGRP